MNSDIYDGTNERLPKFGETSEFQWILARDFQLDEELRVERLPIRSNTFYFTHDFWLNENTLIFASSKENPDGTNFRFAAEIVIFKLFMPDLSEKKAANGEGISGAHNSKCYITRISPPDLSVRDCVLSHDKKRLIMDCGDSLIIMDPYTLKITDKIPITLSYFDENHNVKYCRGQLSLNSDDRFLMYEVYLDFFYGPNKENWGKSDPSTFIEFFDFKTRKFLRFAYRKAPAFWNHILGNPKNPMQISAALIEFKNPFPTTRESKQRLWLFDLTELYSDRLENVEKFEPESKPLYLQKKNRLTGKYEIVTHECWNETGKFLTFIVRRNKIKRVFVRSGKSEIIMHHGNKINPWHCDGSDPNWIVFDTMNKNTGIWVGDMKNQFIKNICRTNTQKNGQNHHPHPFFSKNLKYIFFNSDTDGIEHVFRVRTPFN